MEQGSSDPDYANLFRHLLVRSHAISSRTLSGAAGFDIHHNDPLRSMSVTQAVLPE